MPAKIEQAVQVGLPMRIMDDLTDGKVVAYIEFELVQLSLMVNVDNRLNIQEHQVPTYAQALYEQFPNESIEDIHLCFKRGATGVYDDKLLRLDLAVISNWMRKYLEEKYAESENQLMAEKETFFQPVQKDEPKPNPDRNLLALLKKVVGDHPYLKENNAKENAYYRERMGYKPLPPEEVAKRDLHLLYVRENYDKYTAQPLTTWIPEAEWLRRREEQQSVIEKNLINDEDLQKVRQEKAAG